jgi:aspartate kinase
MIVMKFGGTSTQDAIAMAIVAEIVKKRIPQQPIVIISAIAQATNMLEQIGTLASEGKEENARTLLQQLLERHHAIVNEVIKNSQRKSELQSILDTSLNELEELVKGISILRELTPRTLDSLYCYGELLSSRLVANVLQEFGVDAVWLDTKNFMITDESFTRAMPMMEMIEEKLNAIVLPLIKQGKVPVTQGFIGVTQTGRRTTMGRESSDYSAAIIGTALNVDDIQIWTDVDGVLTADPRVVFSPKKIKVLSFEEAYELSYFGAKVLHPNTMLPAIEKNIPIHIYNSKRPNGSGTLVTKSTNHQEPIVKSVAYKRNVTMLTVSPKKRFSQYIFWEHIYAILTKYSAQTSMTTTSEYNVSFALENKNYIEAIIHELNEIGYASVFENKGIVCVVGSHLQEAHEVVKRIFSALSPVTPSMISFGASASNISLVVNDDDVLGAVHRIHKEFFESEVDSEIFEALPER